jgi:hypothetical protein
MTAVALAPFRADTVLLGQLSVLAQAWVRMHMAGWCVHVVELGWDAKGVE